MDKNLAITLGNAARQARKALGLTHERVAEQLGVSVEFYSRIERGRALPSTETFERMLSVLAVSADTLFGLDAARLAAPASYALVASDDPPEVRRLVSALQAHLLESALTSNQCVGFVAQPKSLIRASRLRRFDPSRLQIFAHVAKFLLGAGVAVVRPVQKSLHLI